MVEILGCVNNVRKLFIDGYIFSLKNIHFNQFVGDCILFFLCLHRWDFIRKFDVVDIFPLFNIITYLSTFSLEFSV